MFWMWCSTQNQSALPFVGFLRHSMASIILCIWPGKNKILTFSKKPWYKSWIGLQTPNILEAKNRDQNKNKKNPFKNQTAAKSWLLLRSTGFGDVEVLSDLFLRDRLERLHVPYCRDVVPPEVGFVLRQSHRLKPCVGVPLSKNPPKLIPLAGVMLSKNPGNN